MPFCIEQRNNTSTTFKFMLLIACAILGVMTLSLLFCVINKELRNGGAEINNQVEGEENKERRGQGTGTHLVQLGHYY